VRKRLLRASLNRRGGYNPFPSERRPDLLSGKERRLMHELSMVQSLLEQVRSFMPDGAALREIRLEVGGLEHLDGQVMQSAFDALTQGATLRITRIPVRLRCGSCRQEYEPEDAAVLLCPHCGAVRPEILQGTGVLLRSLEVDQPDD
jgi:hydrogenase nickel incorporation protein HypA/HybF